MNQKRLTTTVTRMMAGFTVCCLLINLANRSVAQGEDRPPVRVDGGSRTDIGLCPATEKGILAIVPATKVMRGSTPTPKLWFYSPYSPTSVLTAKLTVRDERGKLAMNAVSVQLPKAAGIMSVLLPKALDLNKSYRWYFSVICDAANPSKNPGIEGPMRRVQISPEIAARLKKANSPEQTAAVYIKADFWSDAIALLVQRRTTNPEAKKVWADLLKAEQLEDITAKPNVR